MTFPKVAAGSRVVVIGGGASGVLMAAHLLSREAAGLHVTLIESRHVPGCGIAYSTPDPEHLLNTRVHNMSAFPADPHHFAHWLEGRPEGAGLDGQSFVSRITYGAYLAGLLDPWGGIEGGARLKVVRQECIGLTEDATGVTARLADGSELQADLAILATGHVLPATGDAQVLTGAWDLEGGVAADQPVVIIGSGLSMVDQVLSLLGQGHRGPITAVSRRGLLPRSHAPVKALAIRAEELPEVIRASTMMAWVRAQVARAEAAGGTWRDAIDGIRPHVRALWVRTPIDERARFLRHATIWWDVHRHRIPPASEARIQAARDSGQLRLLRGAFIDARPGAAGQLVARIRPHGGGADLDLPAGRVIDCRGIRRDPERNASPLMADLFGQGRARIDALRIGLDVAPDCRILDRDGRPAARILAIGPVSRSAFWEITAIPDIREQVGALADQLTTAG